MLTLGYASMSSRASGSNCRNSTGGASIASVEMAYRRLSFENDLFTATAYKRNYRNQLINHLFSSTQSQSLTPKLPPETRVISTVPSAGSGALNPNNRETLQVHVQKEFTSEQTKQCYTSHLQSLTKSNNDKFLLEACRNGNTELVGSVLRNQGSYHLQSLARKHLLLEVLKYAILDESHDIVRELLDSQIPLSISRTNGWLPLQFAAHRGDVTMVQILLEAGANVSGMASGTQPIHIASHRGSLEITSHLLGAGAAVDSTDIFGFQPIHLASAYMDRSAQITLLISKGANIEAFNPLAPSWQTSPLQLACLTGHLANVRALLDLGAMKDTGRNLLDAPLGIAIRQGHMDIVKALLEQGADPNYACKSKRLTSFATRSFRLGGPGMTPLSLLVKLFGDIRRDIALDQAMLDVLLMHGADVRLKDDEGNHVLHYLCKSKSSVNLDFKKGSNGERTALRLLGQGVDMNNTNDNGECPLYLAAVNCNEQLVHLLLRNGARYLSSAELFRLYKIVEGMDKRRPDMRDSIKEMVNLLSPERGKRMVEKVPRRT